MWFPVQHEKQLLAYWLLRVCSMRYSFVKGVMDMETLLFSDQLSLFSGTYIGLLPFYFPGSRPPLADTCHSTERKLVRKALLSSLLQVGH